MRDDCLRDTSERSDLTRFLLALLFGSSGCDNSGATVSPMKTAKASEASAENNAGPKVRCVLPSVPQSMSLICGFLVYELSPVAVLVLWSFDLSMLGLQYPAGKLAVVFGSQTGTAEGFAKLLAGEGKAHGTHARHVADKRRWSEGDAGETSFLLCFALHVCAGQYRFRRGAVRPRGLHP